jgi:thiosulfate reductase cytochrome b subunit
MKPTSHAHPPPAGETPLHRTSTSQRVRIYTRFNRFWHWSQALLILLLALTGLEIHGTVNFFGFEHAVVLHNRLAGAFGVLLAFAIFWHFTTGQWRHYTPTRQHLREMVHFYLRGIFHGEHHPFKKTELSRLNPLQRLTYLALKLLIFPVQAFSGVACYYYNDMAAHGWSSNGIGTIALIHTAGMFALLAFLIAHVYLITTGTTLTSNLSAMITGWEEVPVETRDRHPSKHDSTVEATIL